VKGPIKVPTSDRVHRQAEQAKQIQVKASVQSTDGKGSNKGKLIDDCERNPTDLLLRRNPQDLRDPYAAS
jgi:hypothetical protein